MSVERLKITTAYAEWTALSALRSGSPVKSRDAIYPALRRVRFADLVDLAAGSVDASTFALWHRAAVGQLVEELGLCVGWAAKLINVYLKTLVYIGAFGRPGLRELLHPPIDGGLWKGLGDAFKHEPSIVARTHVVSLIKDITSYEDHYAVIIEGCRQAAVARNCSLVEVEQFWDLGAAAMLPEGRHPQMFSVKAPIDEDVLLWDDARQGPVIGRVVQARPHGLDIVLTDGERLFVDGSGSTRVGRWRLLQTIDGIALA